jgi:vacuolar-type H+-ATPase subunit E/Vma4
LQQFKHEILEKLANFSKSSEYSSFLKNLIVQGLIKIEEQVVEIHARAEDKSILARVVRKFVFSLLLKFTFEISCQMLFRLIEAL